MDKLQEQILSEFSKFESSLNGSKKSSIHKERQSAIAELKEKGLPGRKTEDWKFTYLTPKVESFLDFNSEGKSSEDSLIDEIKADYKDGLNVFCLNGEWVIDPSLNLPQGLTVKSFEKAIQEDADLFEKKFNSIASKEDRSFGRLNTAFVKNGLFIHLSKNKDVEELINLHILSDTQKGKTFSQPRILIVCEENSGLNVVENYHQLGDEASYTNSITEISVAKSARVRYYKLQLQEAEYYHSGITAVSQDWESVFSAYAFSFGGTMLRNDLDIHLLGENIESNMFGAYVLNGKTHVDNHSSVNHAMPHCESNELYKGIVTDNATAVFNGKIFVRKDAQKTNAFQSNRNLLLSPDATVHTKPQLEIWADDVKCSHGATIGQLDEEQLFYLRSRGIPKKRAISLLTHAFAGEVIEKIKDNSIRERVEGVLNERMDFEL